MSISTLRPVPAPQRPEPRDPLAEARAHLADLRTAQIGTLEDALIRTVEAAQAVSAGDILHDERTRQLADQIAAANRTLALNLTQRGRT